MRKSFQFVDATAVDAAPVAASDTIIEAGSHFSVQVEFSGTGTLEVYGRLSSAAPWALIDTFVHTDGTMIRAYYGIPEIAGKVTAVEAANTVKAWAFYAK